MNKKKQIALALGLSIALLVGLGILGVPDRLPESEHIARNQVSLRLNQIYADENKAAEAAEDAASSTQKDTAMTPAVFKVKFECTNGDFIVECNRNWAPLGADRFYELVQEGFFDDCGFFRVIPDFVVQFGLAADPAVTAKWKNKRLKDDPVTQSNLPGFITFATSGPDSRTTQLFINTGDNKRLDGMGFSPFGKVTEGLDVVKAINAEYKEKPHQGMITNEGNDYLKSNFPNMDFIKKATLLP